MLQSTVPDSAILYRLEPDPAAAGVPVGSTSRAGLASFLQFAATLGVWRPLKEHLRRPIQERRTGFTHLQKSQALVAALAAGCRHSRDSDFALDHPAADRLARVLPRRIVTDPAPLRVEVGQGFDDSGSGRGIRGRQGVQG
jgi:hypothetical protein